MAPVKSTRALLGQRPTVLLPPSNYVEPSEEDLQAPSSQLQLDWAYGYNGQAVGAVHWISDEEFVFSVAAVAVVQCLHPARQRFFVGHSQRITCLSYCSAWKLCASGQIDPKGGQGPFICLWRPADCILLTVLVCPLHEDQITSLCFSPDGNQLFSLARDSANTLAMWESFLPGKTPCGITSAGMELPHVYRTPVAKVATGKVGGFGMVGSKDAANFQVAIFDAGKTGIGLLLKFVHVVNGSELLGRSAIFPPSSAPRHVLNCAWMDGECLACGDNGYLYMFQGTSASCSQRIATAALGFAVPLKNKELLVASKDSVLHFCHLSHQKLEEVAAVPFSQLKGGGLLTAAGPLRPNTAALGTAGLLIGSENHHLFLLDPLERRVKQLLQLSHTGAVTAMAVHPEPQMKLLATAGAQDATIRFWDVNEHQPVVGRVLKFEEDQSGIFSLAFHSSGRLLACGFGDGQLQLLSFPALKPVPGGRRRAGAERLAALCFLEDDMLAVGSWDQTVYIFSSSSSSKSPLRLLKGNTSSVTHMQCSAEGTYLMTNSKDGQVLYFNVLSGERVTQETVKNCSWKDWSCPMAWHTMGMWAAQRHFGISGIKCCRAFHAVTGEALLAAGDVSHQITLFHLPSLSGKQGFHRYDGHGGFVSCMATVPGADPTTAAALLTLGGDEGALLQWRLVSRAVAARAWHDEERQPQQAMRLREGTKAAAPRRRPPWDFEDAEEEALKGRGAARGPWVQHGGTDLPYAEQLEEPLSRQPRRQGGTSGGAGKAGTCPRAAGAATTSLAAEPKPRRHSLTVAAAAMVAAERLRAAGKTTAAKDERPTQRQHGGLFAERHWLDSGAIIASVARQVKRSGSDGG